MRRHLKLRSLAAISRAGSGRGRHARRLVPRSPKVRLALLLIVTGFVAPTLIVDQSPPGQAATSTVEPSGAALPGDNLPSWKLDFSDDFTGTKLGAAWGWPYEGTPDSKTTWSPSQVSVSDGMLQIADTKVNGAWVTGGLALTGHTHAYGKYLVRMRIDPSDDMTYAVLLWPAVGWPPEIDIAEDAGGNRHSITSTLHYGSASSQRITQSHVTTDMSDWHTVGVEWTPGKIVYTIDGTTYGTVTGSSVPSQPMFLAIQAQSGGCSRGYITCPLVGSPSGAKLQVDWVATYQPDGVEVSTRPDRSSPTSLSGATLSSSSYIFAPAASTSKKVTFALDGSTFRTEVLPAWDMGGTNTDGTARAVTPATLGGGVHTVTTATTDANGTTTSSSATFTVVAPATSPLRFSTNAARTGSQNLANARLTGTVYIFDVPTVSARSVAFYLDGTGIRNEVDAPYDIAGSAANGQALPANLGSIAKGKHTITSVATALNGTTETTKATFTVY